MEGAERTPESIRAEIERLTDLARQADQNKTDEDSAIAARIFRQVIARLERRLKKAAGTVTD